MTSWLASGRSDHNPEPLYYTPRHPTRETIGGDVARILARCQKKLIVPMPWQRDFLDVVCEIDPETGLFWYRTVVLILPRQGGKTTLVRAKIAHRGIIQRGAQMLYTAQDRNSARRRLEKTIYEPLRDSPLSKYMAKPRWSPGSEVVRFQGGSELRIESLSKTAGHGDTLDEAHIDEAFAHKDNRIEQNVSPTMITVLGAQKWFTSAAGDAESVLLNGKQEKGRAAVQLGRDSRTCYWEYGAPEGADPDDPLTYLCHPAVGHTIRLEDIVDERDTMDATEFERAYLSWTPKPKDHETPIPMAAWKSNYVNPEYETWRGKPMWCIDVSPDRAWASIGLAARSYDPEARVFLEVVDHEEGTAWLVGRLVDLANRFGGRRVVIDANGAAGSLEEDLTKAGFEVIALTANQRMDACGALYDDVVDGKVRYLEDPVLTGAMTVAAKMRASGGEAWIFVRDKSRADITPLYSVTLARYAFVLLPEEYDVLQTVA
jgi:phage terminase large subunit-like protein